jgi:DNA-binding transcriptional MerR regulator/methylmalonyl-CoA mutase cobalamin-binding subunit
MTDAPNRQARYPLRAVMRRTGLSADVIRAWERRYGAVSPERSEGGQRLYTERDVVRLGLLARATGEGHSIGEIARLDEAALEALLRRPSGRGPDEERSDEIAAVVADALGATARLESMPLETILKRAVFSLGVEQFVDEVVGRFLEEVGNRWHSGAISPAHEHLASNTMRRVLAWVTDAYELDPEAPRILIATPSGEMHELGAMTAAAAAVGEGWRVVYLGASLPARDIASAAAQVGAQAVALSVVYVDGASTAAEVGRIARSLPVGVELFIGGAAAHEVDGLVGHARVRVLEGIDQLRRTLRAAHAGRSGFRPRDTARGESAGQT